MASTLDRAWRIGLRLGFSMARQWWRLRRPAHRGAMVAVWHGGRVLMVRQSYRPELCFPGGGLDRDETPRDAARRELAEELGLPVEPGALRLALCITRDHDFRRDEVSVFDLHLSTPPVLRIDGREVVGTAWMRPGEALAGPVSPFVRARLEAPPRPD